METPTMFDSRPVAPETRMLSAYFPVPGMGVLPINAFVIRGTEPVLVDTGLVALQQDFMARLSEAIDPADLRWIWLTHTDADHVGNLAAVLDAAPQARVVTTFLGMGKLMLLGLPVERVHLLNPGQELDAGDRSLRAISPPTFDAPETTGLFDTTTRALFSADCFGALMAEPAETAEAMPADALREGGVGWAAVDAPWLHGTDRAQLAARLNAMRELAPEAILGSHLPPARGTMLGSLADNIVAAADGPAFVGPDQAALEAMMSAA